MNMIKSIKSALAGLVLAGAVSAFGAGATISLQMTNYILSGQSLTSYPTNVVQTNGLPGGTGRCVYVGSAEHYGFNFQGWAVNTNASTASTIGINFVTSMANGTPLYTVVSNSISSNYTTIDFSTAGSGVIPITISIPANSTNWVNYQTNFPQAATGQLAVPLDVNWIGIYQITNNLNSTCSVTNASALINIKLIPHPAIGQ
jgi:hypothetical protein